MRQTRQHVAAEMVGAQGMVPAAQWPQHRGKVLPQRVHPSERPEQREAGDGQHHGPADPTAWLVDHARLPASSDKTTRHRLNRGGNRRANAALHRVAVVRMRSYPETKAYVHRRTAEGKSLREIRRCLKRYIAQEIFNSLCRPTAQSAVSNGP